MEEQDSDLVFQMSDFLTDSICCFQYPVLEAVVGWQAIARRSDWMAWQADLWQEGQVPVLPLLLLLHAFYQVLSEQCYTIQLGHQGVGHLVTVHRRELQDLPTEHLALLVTKSFERLHSILEFSRQF